MCVGCACARVVAYERTRQPHRHASLRVGRHQIGGPDSDRTALNNLRGGQVDLWLFGVLTNGQIITPKCP